MEGHLDMSYQEDSRWSYYLVRTRDGVTEGRMEPASPGSWARRLDNGSSGSHVFHLASYPEAWGRMRPARRTLVVCYDDEPVYAGVIWRATYSRNNGTVTLNHEDIWSIWSLRQASPRYLAEETSGLLVKDTQISYSGLTRRTLAKRIVELGMTGIDPDPGAYSLPILFPSDASGGWGRTFRTIDWLTVTDRLQDLAGQGGPMQVDFAPVWQSAGNLAWDMRVSHNISDPTLVLHADVEDSPVLSLSVTNDVSEYASEYHVTGSGQGTDALHRYWSSSFLADDQVALARVWSDGTIEDGDELSALRDGLLERHTNASVQVDCTVAVGSDINPANLLLGQPVIVRTNNDPILPAGDVETMLIGFSPDGPGSLKLELSPVDGFTGHSVVEPSMHYRNLNVSRVSELDRRVGRAEHRLVYPAGGATAASTTAQEET